MKMVKEILREKGSDVHVVHPATTMYEALQLMAEKNIGALVVEESGKCVGIVSEREYARKSVALCASPKECRVSALMSGEVFEVGPESTIEDCMKLMTEQRVRHLPVMEEGKMIGLISIGDVVKALLTEQTNIIAQLENYITGAS